MSKEARVAQWHALSREITARATASEPAAKPFKQLPADGAGCVELFISAPGGVIVRSEAPLNFLSRDFHNDNLAAASQR